MAVRESMLRVADKVVVRERRDDLSLLHAVAHQRDASAFNELCERYQKRALSLSFCILRNAALAEEAVQEALLSIWLSARIAQIENAESWILGIVANKSINARLSQIRRTKREERMAMERNEGASTGSDAVEYHDLVVALRSEIHKLPELECTLLASCFGANMPQRDVAKLVGLSQRTISNKLQKTLEELRANCLFP
jgi:RNA polymerase sigma-70 factor (ECF subfamily)